MLATEVGRLFGGSRPAGATTGEWVAPDELLQQMGITL